MLDADRQADRRVQHTDAVAHIVDCSQPHLMELVASKNITKLFDHYPSEGEWRVIDATVCAPIGGATRR